MKKYYLNTFLVEDSILKISYKNYEAFNNRYGYIFYKVPYSHYRLKLEYRFVGDKLPDSHWRTSNNIGVMIHSESPGLSPCKQKANPLNFESSNYAIKQIFTKDPSTQF